MNSAYAAASYDFNPLHLGGDWMADAEFGRTSFGHRHHLREVTDVRPMGQAAPVRGRGSG